MVEVDPWLLTPPSPGPSVGPPAQVLGPEWHTLWQLLLESQAKARPHLGSPGVLGERAGLQGGGRVPLPTRPSASSPLPLRAGAQVRAEQWLWLLLGCTGLGCQAQGPAPLSGKSASPGLGLILACLLWELQAGGPWCGRLVLTECLVCVSAGVCVRMCMCVHMYTGAPASGR